MSRFTPALRGEAEVRSVVGEIGGAHDGNRIGDPIRVVGKGRADILRHGGRGHPHEQNARLRIQVLDHWDRSINGVVQAVDVPAVKALPELIQELGIRFGTTEGGSLPLRGGDQNGVSRTKMSTGDHHRLRMRREMGKGACRELS